MEMIGFNLGEHFACGVHVHVISVASNVGFEAEHAEFWCIQIHVAT